MVDTWDEAKRQITLAERGLDFADAELVFAGRHFTRAAERRDYGEERFVTVGHLHTFRRPGVDTKRERTADYLDEAWT